MDKLDLKLKSLATSGLLPTDEALKSQQLAKARMAFESASKLPIESEGLFSWSRFFGAGMVAGGALALCFVAVFTQLPMEVRNSAGAAAGIMQSESIDNSIKELESLGLHWYVINGQMLSAELGNSSKNLNNLVFEKEGKSFHVGLVQGQPLKLTFIENQPSITIVEIDGHKLIRCSSWQSEQPLESLQTYDISGWKLKKY